jgi:indole-3-glycerol phosphate synthase
MTCTNAPGRIRQARAWGADLALLMVVATSR